MRTKVDYRKIYEKYKGKIPIGFHIHHADGNSNNNHSNNLVALSPLDHYKIHLNQGDKKEAALLLGLIMRGGTSKLPYLGDIPHKDALALYRMEHGLIKIPTNKRENGHPDIEVRLMDMDWVVDDHEPYDDSKLDFVNKLLNTIKNKKHKIILDKYYGINYRTYSQKEIAKEYKTTESNIQNIVFRAIKKLKKNYA